MAVDRGSLVQQHAVRAHLHLTTDNKIGNKSFDPYFHFFNDFFLYMEFVSFFPASGCSM